ncbi:hypothetical protein BFM12_07615 [Campylobacter jejuni]|uniref:hypothetical protein n=1 Tax=Campylobacter jejuni TaxID=197 RepID=UPI00126C71FC|nr:hypothetical protein [Campylobacter jejuni]EAK2109856.1 hypothetical protein [Campylobacter jejuni]EAL7061378.1 hypothetical protein [Campylobacter jejuni]EHR9968451.1 hypothetical protein [Campylobacter jejuni]NBE34242.1 hypothetical protein [Campylobacter jejuni]NBE86446.1 hypothetical protein [Campylobacter jejuni]
MSPKQIRLRKQLLTKIHMHKEYLYYKKHNAWQDFLTLRFEVKSSKDLSIDELKILLDIFDGKIKDNLSFTPDLKGRAILKKSSSTKQFFYLKALLEQNKMNIFSFYKLCKKTLKKDVFSLLDLNKKDCTTMIVVLEKILKAEQKNKK